MNLGQMEQRRLIRYPTPLLGQASTSFCQKEDPFAVLETVDTRHTGPSMEETALLSWAERVIFRDRDGYLRRESLVCRR